ncbi:MAG: glycosyltransferase family 2 protein [Candidatus Levyibacteriota bacterium]|nr:MAG: glycosyltransferase family 2 protein [Candidatus Levybacteria bacterium]
MISAVILTKNEEENIEVCIKGLRWCNEVIVVDDNSTDKTREIAEKLGAKVIDHSLNNNFSEARNYGLEQTKGEWVLFVDADERISDSLAFEIGSMLTMQAVDAYDAFYIRRIDTIWGRQLLHGENGMVKFIRLAKKTKGEWKGAVHETWQIKGRVGQLKNPLYHYPHQTVSEFLTEINYYTTIRAQELYKKRVKVHVWDIILYPKAKFFVNYVLKRGFLDGMPGLVVAILMSFHSYLVRGKLWLLWQKK